MSAVLSVSDPILLGFAEEVGADGPVAVEGRRTRWSLGGDLEPGVRLVEAPSGIVEYVPDEMTVRVRCGTPVEELHAALAERGQRTALPERGGTVGGAIAVGENDVHVLGRGRVRDAALQLRYVSDDGVVITGGGPTVKNVTGFDLPRLMVGSLGTLGLLAEAILRTNPIPAVTEWVVSEDADPFSVLDTVLRPGAVLWNGARTWVQLEGHRPAVQGERTRLSAIGTWSPTDGAPPLPPHRWSMPAGALADPAPFGDEFVASIGVGSVWSTVPQPTPTLDPGVAELTRRIKDQFDPRGRLNPGRRPEVR